MKLSPLIFCLLLVFTSRSQTINETKQDERKSNNDIAGSPYLMRDWCYGIIRFSSGRVVSQFKLKFDCLNNQLILQFEGSSFAAESKITEFVMYPKSGRFKNDTLLFRKGFPSVGEKSNENTFYQVVQEGRAQLLRLFVKVIIEEKQLVGGSSSLKSGDEERYYLYEEKKMYLFPAEKNRVHEAFPAKNDEMKQWISSQSLKMRSAAEYAMLVQYYNSLN